MMQRIWPRSLAGQMALIIAVALFFAQAINFALLLQERNKRPVLPSHASSMPWNAPISAGRSGAATVASAS
jgi:hypothetical protein